MPSTNRLYFMFVSGRKRAVKTHVIGTLLVDHCIGSGNGPVYLTYIQTRMLDSTPVDHGRVTNSFIARLNIANMSPRTGRYFTAAAPGVWRLSSAHLQ